MMTWTKAALIRAIKTFFQTFVATIGTTAVLSEVQWKVVLSASALAAILSLATSLAGLPEADDGVKQSDLDRFEDDLK